MVYVNRDHNGHHYNSLSIYAVKAVTVNNNIVFLVLPDTETEHNHSSSLHVVFHSTLSKRQSFIISSLTEFVTALNAHYKHVGNGL